MARRHRRRRHVRDLSAPRPRGREPLSSRRVRTRRPHENRGRPRHALLRGRIRSNDRRNLLVGGSEGPPDRPADSHARRLLPCPGARPLRRHRDHRESQPGAIQRVQAQGALRRKRAPAPLRRSGKVRRQAVPRCAGARSDRARRSADPVPRSAGAGRRCRGDPGRAHPRPRGRDARGGGAPARGDSRGSRGSDRNDAGRPRRPVRRRPSGADRGQPHGGVPARARGRLRPRGRQRRRRRPARRARFARRVRLRSPHPGAPGPRHPPQSRA